MVPVSLLDKRKKEPKKPNKYNYFLLLIIGILGGCIAPFLFFEGLHRTSASDASVLEGGELLFTAMIAILFFKEKLTKVGYLGMAVTIVGIILVSLSNADLQNNLYNFKLNLGNILIVLATLCWGLDNNISKTISNRITNTSKIVVIKSLIGGFLLLIISIYLGYNLSIEFFQMPYMFILGIGGFGLSLFFFIEALRTVGTLKVIVIFSSSAVFGLFFSYIILNDKITIMQLISTVLVILGIYYVNKDELNYLKNKRQF